MNTITKLATVALALALLFVGDSILTRKTADANPPAKNTDTRRVFYLTQGIFTGGQALTACTTGFHMASIWEIDDTTVLRYDSTLGRTNGDSGPGGPPAITAGNGGNFTALGWIRTGTGDSTCQNWTSSSSADTGSLGLPVVVANGGFNPGGNPTWVILGTGLYCDGTSAGTQINPGVWCVQD